LVGVGVGGAVGAGVAVGVGVAVGMGVDVGAGWSVGAASDMGVGSEVPAEETGAGGALSALWGGRGRGILVAVGKEEKGVGVGLLPSISIRKSGRGSVGVAAGASMLLVFGGAEGPMSCTTSSTSPITDIAMVNALIIRF
jgi:hypothetical protein